MAGPGIGIEPGTPALLVQADNIPQPTSPTLILRNKHLGHILYSQSYPS